MPQQTNQYALSNKRLSVSVPGPYDFLRGPLYCFVGG